jgi:hypothetical protein
VAFGEVVAPQKIGEFPGIDLVILPLSRKDRPSTSPDAPP